MTSEDSSSSVATSEVNPFWAAAQARLQDAGIGSAPKSYPQVNMAANYYSAAPAAPYSYFPYATVPMPPVSADPYAWPAQYIPPPPPPRPMMQRPQRLDSTRVPYDYRKNQPTPQRPQKFVMSFPRQQNGNRFISSNPLANAPVDDTLGDPKKGFFLKGRHPPSLKSYVSRALAYPKTPAEMTKCENYLYSKIEPLMLSGAVFHVRWDTEPLPHEKNYELVTSWTPASKGKTNGSASSSLSSNRKKENNRDHFSSSRSERNKPGPDIPLVAPPRNSFSKKLSPTPIMQRGNVTGSNKKNKKRKNNSFGSLFDDDEEDVLNAKRVKGERFGTNHSDNWLEDWIYADKNRTRLSGDMNFLSLQERPYRRRAVLPMRDRTRLWRSFPKVLNNLGQENVDEYFNRNEGRFDPNDCDEIIGTCYELEKKFFRLTKKPDASEIRPPSVLRKAFLRLQTVAKDQSKYKYVCDQIRAIRQDLTVQKIRDKFTVEVYEFHARLTLENKDLGEFNQCQSQLRHLYADLPDCKNEYEFTAYRLLYYIYTEDDQDILSLLNELDSKAQRSPSISFAIKVHNALLKGHYIKLFKLYQQPPRMCGYMLDLFLERERKKFIKIIRASYHPNLEVSLLSNWFQFSSEKEFVEYLKAQGIEVQIGGKTEPKKWPIKA